MEKLKKEQFNLILENNRFLIHQNLKDREIFSFYINLLKSLIKENKEAILDNYYLLCSALLEYNELQPDCSFPVDPWENFILNFILSDENILSRKITSIDVTKNDSPLVVAFKQDLRFLEKLFKLNLKSLADYIISLTEDPDFSLFAPDWSFNCRDNNNWNFPRDKVKKQMFDSPDWPGMVADLIDYFQKNGTGVLNSYKAFNWHGRLRGINNIDNISFDQIIGYKKQKEKIISNTEKLIRGYQANNVLLYGARGTGKSSTVKAVLNRFWTEGLRLIEVEKKQFKCFPEMFDRLAESNLYFIIFIDDLSFEESETGYKELKATLEGKTKLVPANVVIYTTSNRKYLIKESYAGEINQIRRKEAEQEQLSLADRFGITILFSSPTQKEYLKIVKHLARQRKINIAEIALVEKAKQWALWQNGRSGRTARQFIDNLEADLSKE